MAKATEFVLQPGKTPILIVEPYGSSFKLAVRTLRRDAGVQVAECASSLDAAALARRLGICLIICHVSSSADTVKHGTMLKLLQQGIKRKEIRVLVTASLRDEGSIGKLSIMGCAEVMREPVTEKSLLFKVERHLRMLPSAVRAGGGAAGAATGAAAQESGPAQTRWETALVLESDCWLYGRNQAKRIGGKWVVKLRGPDMADGEWVALDSPSRPGWQWMPADPENDPFIKEEGAWVFFGQRPEFQSGHWTFIAKDPELSFYYEGERYGSKLSTDELGTLVVARDSAAAGRAFSGGAGSASSSGVADASSSATSSTASATDELVAQASKRLAAGSLAEAPRVFYEASVELESDCWLLEGRKPKRVSDKWIIHMKGPGPAAGRWSTIEDATAPDADEPYWQWVPSDPENDEFIKEQGAWVYRGIQPRFQDEVWVFVGRAPELQFFYEGESYGAKFQADGSGHLHVARDSATGKTLLPRLEATLERVFRTADAISTASADGAAAAEGGDAAATAAAGGLSAGAAADAVEEGAFHYTARSFNANGGEWEAASVGSQMRRWFIFIPTEVLNGEVPDIRRLNAYWSYFGKASPRSATGADGKPQWIFTERRPQSCSEFGDLPKPVQQFLLDYFPGSGEDTGAEAEAPAEPVDSGAASTDEPRSEPETVNEAVSTRPSLKTRNKSASTKSAPAGAPDAHADAETASADLGSADEETVEGSGEAPVRLVTRERSREPGRSARAERDSVVDLGSNSASSSISDSDSDSDSKSEPTAPRLAKSGKTADDKRVFRIDSGRFGRPGGEWEAVSFGSGQRRWFVYVPAEVLAEEVADIRRLGIYWTYFGELPQPVEGREGKKHWVFRERRPQSVTVWADLPRPVQEFLVSYFPGSVEADAEAAAVSDARDGAADEEGASTSEAADAGAAAGDDVFDEAAPLSVRPARKRAGAKGADGVSAAAHADTSADGGSATETETEVEGEGEPAAPLKLRERGQGGSAAASAAIDRGEESESFGDETEVEDVAGVELRSRLGRRSRRKRSGTDASGDSSATAHTADFVESAPSPIRTSTGDELLVALKAERPVDRPDLVVTLNPASPELQGPIAIAATHPPGPSLSPLALAFLVSELMCKREFDPKRMAERFCAYLGASCGGLRAELWLPYGQGSDDESGWFCAGTVDGTDGRYGDTLAQSSLLAAGRGATLAGATRFGDVLVAPVSVSRPGAPARLLGVLMLGEPGSELVKPAYLETVAKLVRGIAIALAADGAAAA